MVGFLVSATLNKTHQAARHMTDLLLEVLEDHYEAQLATLFPTNATAAAEPGADPQVPAVEMDIEKEVQQEIEQAQHPTFSPLTTITNLSTCLFFIQLHPGLAVDPARVCQHIFESLQRSGSIKSRFIHRIIPFQTVCKSYMDDIHAKLEALVERVVATCETKAPFRISLKIRCNQDLDKDALVSKVADIFIQREHKVNLNHPQINVLIEVIGKHTGLSIVQDGLYNQFFKFNLQELYAKCVHEKHTSSEPMCDTDKVKVIMEENKRTSDEEEKESTPSATSSSTVKPTVTCPVDESLPTTCLVEVVETASEASTVDPAQQHFEPQTKVELEQNDQDVKETLPLAS